ncbi:MAG: hypothetical protein OXR73_18540 [Myxococcales bacterium]|nr:hypothetical protein [Myxococcales bacterium]
MPIETLAPRRKHYPLLVALLGSYVFMATGACNESNGTQRLPGTYKPEAQIDRMYPDPPADGGADEAQENMSAPDAGMQSR